MKKEEFQPINVLNIFRGFAREGLQHPITPYRFETKDGNVHHIKQIRAMHRERIGKIFHYHFVVQTKEEKNFHLVFDTSSLTWRMIQEVGEDLFFFE